MVIRILFSLLLFSCIFDPADLIFGFKVPLFILVVGYSFVTGKFSLNNRGLFAYIFLFSFFLPILSYLIGNVTNEENYDDPNFIGAIKPYLFLIIAFAFQKDIKLLGDIIKIFAYELLLLSIVSLMLFIFNVLGIIPFEILYEFGKQYTLFAIGERTFGPFVINRIYFHTAPMLVFALCYFINIFCKDRKVWSILVSLIITASLFISGTRNDMIMGMLPYFVMAYIHGSKRVRMRVIIISSIFIIYLFSQEFVLSLFDKTEESNDTKIGFLDHYYKSFSNIRTLILGDGLDSYFTVKERGRVNITELTYFELFRRFGLVGAFIYLYLMFKPAIELLRRKNDKWIGLAYFMYLIMIFFNPFFFSSNGMVILSIVLVVYYANQKFKIKSSKTSSYE